MSKTVRSTIVADLELHKVEVLEFWATKTGANPEAAGIVSLLVADVVNSCIAIAKGKSE